MGNIGSNVATEKDLLQLLDILLQSMLLVETIESFQLRNVYNRQLIKNHLNKTLAVLIPVIEKDYPLVFNAGPEDSLQVISNYDKLIHFIRDFNVPQKEKLTQMIEAYNFDKKTMDATTHRIIKKHNK